MTSPLKLGKIKSNVSKAESNKIAVQINRQGQILSKIEELANKLKPEHYTMEQVKNDYKTKSTMYQQALKNVQTGLQGRKMRQYDALVGRKLRKTILDELGIDYKDVTVQDQKALDFLLIEDDFVESVKGLARTAGKYVKPLIKPILSASFPELLPLVDQFLPSPNTVNSSETVRVRRRYLLAAVSQPVANVVQAIDCNPGLLQFGQWLSLVAKAFQFYKVHSVTFEYVTSTALTTQGAITYYLEMDKNAPAPGAQDIGQQYKVTQHALFEHSTTTYTEEELHQMVKRFHIRNEAITPEEASIYDFGTFYYYCSNQSATQYGQFFIDIDISFYVPTLQTAYSDVVSQAAAGSIDYFGLTTNNLLIPSGGTRTLNGISCITYTCQVSGTMYGYAMGKGTNTSACAPLSYCRASSAAETPTYATAVYTQTADNAGNRMISIWYTLSVQAGQVIWLTKSSGSFETYNQQNVLYLTMNSRNLPYTTLTMNVNQSRKEMQSQFQKFMSDTAVEKAQLQNKIERLANIVEKMQLKPLPLRRQNATPSQIEEQDTEFSF